MWHMAGLVYRHTHAVVYPVMLVTDSGVRYVPDRWVMTVARRAPLMLQVQVYRVTSEECLRLRSLTNRVAAILATLDVHNGMDAVDAVASALEQMDCSLASLADLDRFLPFVLKLANIQDMDMPRLRRRREEIGMINLLTEMKNDARAAGRAEAMGLSSGLLESSFRRLVERGAVTRADARAELQNLIDAGAITREFGQEALAQFT